MALDPNDLNDQPPPSDPAKPQWDPPTRTYIEQLRQESAGHRTRNKTLESQNQVLQAQLKAASGAQEIRSLKLTNALLRTGSADPEMLEFFLRKEGKWDDLDPEDADTLKDRVDDLLGRRPELKHRNVPTRSSSG